MFRLSLLSAFVILSCFSQASAKDIFLSSTGDDSNNGQASTYAVLTFDKAYKLARNGDVIQVSGIIDMSNDPGLSMGNGDNGGIKAGYIVRKNITIQGTTVAMDGFDGRNLTRIFQVTGSNTVTFKNMTLKNGKYLFSNLGGGALYVQEANITCENVVFDNNSSFDATCSGGAVVINATAGATFKNCVFSNNNGSGGGAIRLYDVVTTDAIVRIEGCSFINNTSITGGGAALWIRMKGETAHNAVNVINSTFTNNNCHQGTIYLYSVVDPSTTVNITNCTVTANKPYKNGCSGVLVFMGFLGKCNINNSIIEGNFGGAEGVLPYNDLNNESGPTVSTLEIHNSIIGRVRGKSVPAECYAGENKFDYLTEYSTESDMISKLGVFDAVRKCFPLQATSLAKNYGDAKYLQALNVTTDQMGTKRSFDKGKCFAGAVELIAKP